MPANDRDREMKFQLWGWILFMVCAVFFIASSLKDGSILSLVGSLVFLLACIVFIIPIVTKGNPK
ncbi:MAG: hypothetical protein PVG99_04285 [Desulfobacteraceae bacterium]|jgi:hypothetical protein